MVKRALLGENLFKQFKRFAPDWLEQLPEIPPLIYNALQTLQQKNSDNNSAPEVANNAKAILPKTRKWFPWVGGAALGAGEPLWNQLLKIVNSCVGRLRPYKTLKGLIRPLMAL